MARILITEQVTGILPVANGGTNATTAVWAIDSLTTQGTDIVSSSTTNLAAATGLLVRVTGTTTVTAFGTAAAGVERQVIFTGALILTYNATSLILPTTANITTAAGDTATFFSLGSGNWVCTSYQRASGAALSGVWFTPNKVSVWHNASQFSSVTPNTYTSLAFNQERYDTASMHDNVTNNSRLVSQYIWRVRITAGVSYFSATSGNTNRVRILKNWATVIATREEFDNSGGWSQNYFFDLSITDTTTAITDYYEFQIASSANGNLNTYASIDRVNFELETVQ